MGGCGFLGGPSGVDEWRHAGPPQASEGRRQRTARASPRTRSAGSSRSLRSCEEIGWQAEAPAPPRCKSFECSVGQTLSSVNPAVRPISSQLLTLAVPCGTESSCRILVTFVSRITGGACLPGADSPGRTVRQGFDRVIWRLCRAARSRSRFRAEPRA